MGDTYLDDPFGTGGTYTPAYNKLPVRGKEKLLVVIFVVDCSKTMEGERINAVNAALQELKFKLGEIKSDNNLELKMAVMSFTSNVRWELPLTPIDEATIGMIQIRPGLTEYGAVYHELDKVLRKEKFMEHTGKIAPPAIMFLTDGEPNDAYEGDLNRLLKNGWFASASRSAVLLGDAIYSEDAKKAVGQFVKDEKADIVSAKDSTVIIQKIKIATMHTIEGVPMTGGADEGAQEELSDVSERTDRDEPFSGNGAGGDSLGGDNGAGDDPFGGNGAGDDPFGGNGTGDDPFGGSGSGSDPFGGNADPFI